MKHIVGILFLTILAVSVAHFGREGGRGGGGHGGGGHGGGGYGKGKRNCATTDFDCQCRKLMRPKQKLATFHDILSACATETGYTLPSKGHTHGRGWPFHVGRKRRHLNNFPDNMQNCVDRETMKANSLLDASGKIQSAATIAYYTNGTDTSITDAVGTCITEVEGNQYVYADFNKCLLTKCVAAKGG